MARFKKPVETARKKTDSVDEGKHAKPERVWGVPSLEEMAAKQEGHVEAQMLSNGISTLALSGGEKVFAMENKVVWGKLIRAREVKEGEELKIGVNAGMLFTLIKGGKAHYDLVFDDGKSFKDSVLRHGETMDNMFYLYSFSVCGSHVKVEIYEKTSEIELDEKGNIGYKYFEEDGTS